MTEKRWNEQQRGGELSGRIEKIRSKLLGDESVRMQISRRAYELYLSRGGEHGHQLEDWVQAENEILTSLVERELKGSSEALISRSQEGGGGATTAPAAETPAPRKGPTRDESGGGGFTSTKPVSPGATTAPAAGTSALRKVPTRDEGITSAKPVSPGATTRPAAETPATRKAPTRDEDGGGGITSAKPVSPSATTRPAAETPATRKVPTRDDSTKASGTKRTRRKSPEEESPN